MSELTLDTAVAPGIASSRRPGRTAILAAAVILVAAVAALFPTALATHDPSATDPSIRLTGPRGSHWFGTDHLGRDVYSRVIHAAGLSLSATLIAVGLALVVGSIIGLVAATTVPIVESTLMRGVDVLLSIPALVLALAIITALGFGTVNVAVAVGISLIANFARVMHGEALRVRNDLYVEAARLSGVRWPRVIARHVVPNAFGPVGALAVAEFGMAILSISALSFLGFGATPPTPEWGSLISEGRNYLASSWWISTLPGAVIVAIVLATHRLSRIVTDREDAP